MIRPILLALALTLLVLSPVAAQQSEVMLIDDTGGQALAGRYGPLVLATGRTYQAWDVAQSGTLSVEDFGGARTLVWMTGSNASPAGFEGGAAEALGSFLDGGGNVIVIGGHAGTALGDFMAERLGLKIKRHAGYLGKIRGRLPDVIAGGWNLDLEPSGVETAKYKWRAEVKPEIVFFAYDRGVSRLAAVRHEEASGARITWIGFDLDRVSTTERADAVFKRTVDWTAPKPADESRKARFLELHSKAK